MSLTMAAEAPPLSMDETGTIRVAGTRVYLDLIVSAHKRGLTAEEIARQYDVLDLADVYGALRYYLRHREEVEAYLARRGAEADELRATVLSAQRPVPTIAELLSRRTYRTGDRVPVSGTWRTRGASPKDLNLVSGDVFPTDPAGRSSEMWDFVSRSGA